MFLSYFLTLKTQVQTPHLSILSNLQGSFNKKQDLPCEHYLISINLQIRPCSTTQILVYIVFWNTRDPSGHDTSGIIFVPILSGLSNNLTGLVGPIIYQITSLLNNSTIKCAFESKLTLKIEILWIGVRFQASFVFYDIFTFGDLICHLICILIFALRREHSCKYFEWLFVAVS